jgi:HNH endonuclease/AP2 domain
LVKTMTASNGVEFTIDEEDFEKVSKYQWNCSPQGYIRRTVWLDNKTRCETLSLHRFLLSAPKEKIVDHINGDVTDNRKCNLRLANKHENVRNSKPPITNKSGYKGVSLRKESGKWRAQIRVDGRPVNLGHFDNEHDAARMYNFWASDIYGEFAWLNTIREGDEFEPCNNN